MAKRNYYPLATVANKKKCLPLTQNDWSVIENQFNIVFYNKVYTIKNVSCWKKSHGGSIYNMKLLSQNI